MSIDEINKTIDDKNHRVEAAITIDAKKLNYNLYLLTERDKNYIYFSQYIENTSDSLIYQLKEQKYIDYLSISFIPNSTLIFGKLPKHLYHNMNQAHIKVLYYFKEWISEVNKIYIESSVIEENCLAIFSSAHQTVVLSDTIFYILSNIYFQYNGACDIIGDQFICNKNILSKINISLNFEIGDSLLRLDTQTIFSKCDERG